MKRLSDNQDHHNRFLTAITGWWRQADVGTDLNRILVLILLALGLGLIYNAIFIWPKQTAPPAKQPPAKFQQITIERAYQLTQDQQATIVDARDPASYAREHIAGAVNLPSSQFEAHYADFAKQVDKEQTVIVYCATGRGPKERVARQLQERSYQHVYVMAAEPEEWAAAGYPVTTEGDTHTAEGASQ